MAQSRDQIGLLLATTAWCITEVIRYCYYMMALVGDVNRFLQWARYVHFDSYSGYLGAPENIYFTLGD